MEYVEKRFGFLGPMDPPPREWAVSLMKYINLTAGILLITNRAPAFALALLAPVTVVIIWFISDLPW